MNQKKENMKIIRDLIITLTIIILIISYFSKFFFYVNGYFQFNEWITSFIGLIGAGMGGIFTMLGVVLTLNRNISDQEKKEKKELVRIAYLINIESKLFLESIESYLLNMKLGELIVIKDFSAKLKKEENFRGFYEKRYIISDSYKDNVTKLSLLLKDDELWIIEKLLGLDSLSRKLNNVTNINDEFPFKSGILIFREVFDKEFIDLMAEINDKEFLASTILSYGNKVLRENILDDDKLKEVIDDCSKQQILIEDLYNRCKLKHDEMKEKKIHLSNEYEEVFKIINRVSRSINAKESV